MPKVSVIIPNYNHAAYLDQRIQSVLNQTYQDFEVIIMDDCSTDNSVEVIDRYRDDNRITHVIINDKNSGSPFVQWNRGMQLASGDLIWIAESDDFCSPDMLQELIDAYYKYEGTVLTYSTSKVVRDDGSVSDISLITRNQYCSGSYYLRHYLSYGNFIRNASSAIFDKKCAMDTDPSYMKMRGAGDYLFWVNIVSRGRVAIVNKGLNYFRRHEGVVTDKRDSDGTNMLEERTVLDALMNYVRLSVVRKFMVFSFKSFRIRITQFDSPQTRADIVNLWDAWKYDRRSSRLFVRAFSWFVDRYAYYL